MKNTNVLRANDVMKLHTQEKRLPALVNPTITESIEETLDYEKACKKSAEVCAKKLKKVFIKMKKENPGEERYNIYNNEEGRKLIRDFLKMEKGDIDKAKLFSYLHIKLRNLGLISSRPWYGYFTGEPFDFAIAWYTISEKNKKE